MEIIMICKNCGSEINDNERFCTHCGKSVLTDNNKSAKKKNSKRKIIISIAVVCFVLLIIVIVSTSSSGNDSNNSYAENDYQYNTEYGTYTSEPELPTESITERETFYNPIGKEVLQYPSQNDIFTYDVYETYVEITGVSADEIDDNLIIPDKLENLPVRSIGKCAFGAEASMYITSGWTITSVTIPNTVYNIENSAFHKCELLKTVNFGNCLISIGSSAFSSTAITSVNIPDTVTELGSGVFSGCNNLKSVCLGNGVTVIPDDMFASCYNLNQITWGKNVNAIGIGAFSHTGFIKVELPDTIKEIYPSAFAYMENLTEFVFSDSVNMVDSLVLSDCPNLVKVRIGKGITSLPDRLFSNSDNLQEIIIPATVDHINNDVFGGLSKAKPVIYGEKASEAANFASSKGLIFKLIEN